MYQLFSWDGLEGTAETEKEAERLIEKILKTNPQISWIDIYQGDEYLRTAVQF